MKIDWVAKLQHFLQVMAFCLAVATIQYAFQPDRPYAPLVLSSLVTGSTIWAIIDLGGHLFPSSAETGWPQGIAAVGLPVVAIAVGFLVGSLLCETLSGFFGWYATGMHGSAAELRGALLITVMAGTAGSYYFYSINKSAYLERKMGEARGLADEARLKLLETQLEPHMLFNTLANLRALIGADPRQAQEMLDHMIAYLRATLHASRSPTHSLQDEFERLRDYLELMTIRMGPRLKYSLQLPPELAQQSVPTLLLQPLVENSIQHGLEPKLDGGRIAVVARREGANLVLEVADTGVGPAAAPAPRGNGFGMNQVRERLGTLHGAAARIDFAAGAGGGSRTVLTLPLHA